MELHVGLKASDWRGDYEVVDLTASNVRYRYVSGEWTGQTHDGDPAIKERIWRNMCAAQRIAALPPKKPGCLEIGKIDWDAEGRMAWTFGWWAGIGNIRLYLETPAKFEDTVINQYHALTGVVITAMPGLFNIAPESKFGTEAAIYFDPTEDLPDSISRMQSERPGLISSCSLFWALIEHGFQLVRGAQDDLKIRQFIPESHRKHFDRGVEGLDF